ncbi:hypothetical protein OG785_02080 [Streptomyces sp. NBC_00006]|uniref:hypothetical protein n=1 Tax=Streptomyces sp. NBC_00006 TaxID=2975619 RepID=UPI00224FAB10|nr:hypothetical protein [Streptomyces sp. NBC_00006]MCX5529363.1 hypothetical protein [Streptomyces sp. NBC_00006]
MRGSSLRSVVGAAALTAGALVSLAAPSSAADSASPLTGNDASTCAESAASLPSMVADGSLAGVCDVMDQ